jgi:hypothetical protein
MHQERKTMKKFDARGYGPGPDLTKPGFHWRKAINAYISELAVTPEEAAEVICTLYEEKFHEAIRESAKGERDGDRKNL